MTEEGTGQKAQGGGRDNSKKVSNKKKSAIVRVCQLRMIVWLVEPSPCVFCRVPSGPGRALTQKQRGGDPPLFLNENIVRAACRTEVHRLESDAALGEDGAHLGRRKALRRTRAEQHQLGGERQERLEVDGAELREALRLPIGDQPFRSHDAAALHALLPDADLGGRIAPDQVGSGGRFERELHRVSARKPLTSVRGRIASEA